MPKRYDRLMRSITATKMRSSSISFWEPPLDMYEVNDVIIIYIDVAGIDSDNIKIIAEPKGVTIRGERKCPIQEITNVHQLEIEYGFFERRLALPKAIDVGETTSQCKNGFLIIKLPLLNAQGSIKINVK